MKRIAQAGFTLIELVVVIVILGILAAVAAPQFIDTATSARQAVGQSACGAAQSAALMIFASNKGTPPTSATDIMNNVNAGSTGVQINAPGGSCSAFVANVPTNASPVTSVNCAVIPAPLCN